MDNKAVIQQFYAAFARRSAEAMAICYDREVVFEDPVFGTLTAPQAVAMWKMLCKRAHDLQIELVRCEANETLGSADWEAKYTFQKTGKFVHNRVHSEFEFRDGLIVSQHDSFDLWAWASMALGRTGQLLGWTPIIKHSVRKQAQQSLATFMATAK
jgi:ketosteroid isomerase-like protein